MTEKLLIALKELKEIENMKNQVAVAKKVLDDANRGASLLIQMKAEIDQTKYASAMPMNDKNLGAYETGKRVKDRNANLSPKGVKQLKENAAKKYAPYQKKALEIASERTGNGYPSYSAKALETVVLKNPPPKRGTETYEPGTLRKKFSKDPELKPYLASKKK